jgi:hypothetical protein
MGHTACTEPQCLYNGALYLYLYLYLNSSSLAPQSVVNRGFQYGPFPFLPISGHWKLIHTFGIYRKFAQRICFHWLACQPSAYPPQPRRPGCLSSSGSSGWERLPATTLSPTISLTLILLTCRIWWAPNNVSRWQMGFNSAFKGLIVLSHNPTAIVPLKTGHHILINLYSANV